MIIVLPRLDVLQQGKIYRCSHITLDEIGQLFLAHLLTAARVVHDVVD